MRRAGSGLAVVLLAVGFLMAVWNLLYLTFTPWRRLAVEGTEYP
jgi:hypothetical protein